MSGAFCIVFFSGISVCLFPHECALCFSWRNGLMKIVDRYILKAHAAPFLFAFLTIIFVFTLQFFSLFIARFVGKGLDLLVISELILLQISWMVVLAVPMAVLVSTLMAFGNLTNRSEIAVMRSGGLSMSRVILPVLIAASVLAFLVERFNNVVLPEANYQAKMLLRDITKTKPSFGLTENAFSSFIDGYSILVRDIDPDSGELRGVTIYEGTRDDYSTVITAETGSISFTQDSHYLIMELYNGEIHEMIMNTKEEYRLMSFSRHRFVFSSTGYGFERTDPESVRRGDRDLAADQLKAMGKEFLKRIASGSMKATSLLMDDQKRIASAYENRQKGEERIILRSKSLSLRRSLALERVDGMLEELDASIDRISADRRMYNKYMVEYHKKYALSFACIIFVLVGAPLGVLAKRGGFGVGAGLALAFFVLYWALLILGEHLADRNLLHPGFAMWLANILMAFIGGVAYWRVTSTGAGNNR